jgi:hypothetical protein
MSKWSEWKDTLGDARPWHALDPSKKVSNDSTAELRLSTCLSCEHLTASTKQCKLCFCYMPLKTTLANAECPVAKWGREE